MKQMKTSFTLFEIPVFGKKCNMCRCGGMADTLDSKSSTTGVRVQVPPSAPVLSVQNRAF